MILFVRHGQTEFNAKKIIAGGKSDVPLNETGRKQANQAAEKLKNVKIDVVFCSPMKRAKQTARAILKYHKDTPIFYDERLRERDWGEFDGKPDELLPQNFWHLETVLPESVEKVDMLYERLKSFYQEILDKYKNKTVLVVAHNGVARVSGLYFKGVPENKNLDLYSLDNAEIWQLTD